MILSICIPTYNRPECLLNCLNSIVISNRNKKIDFEVCISDNCSDADIEKLINPFKKELNIKFNRNNKNLGFAVNILKVVSMASGDFVWLIGNDDLILPHALEKLNSIITDNSDVDFFYINSFNLDLNYLKNFPKPFDTNNLPLKMNRFSNKEKSQRLNFWDLIDPNVSYDFLLAIYLIVFRREKWTNNLNVVDKELIKDPRDWSNFENTCLHLKIFTSAFNKSKVYFQAEPLSVTLQGAREWKDLYEFIEIIRMPELLDYYRSQGFNFSKFVYCKNYSLRNFIPYLVKILLRGKKGGTNYIKFSKHILKNLIYPNVYLSLIYFIFRKLNILKS